jgi:hypothetical protein
MGHVVHGGEVGERSAVKLISIGHFLRVLI